jgi:SAM-dependent methyltransferase
MLVAAAHRIPHGRGIGVDVWRAVDQSGNHPEAARVNAELEGVADRIEVQTADARQLPFPDGTFDVVLSHWVVHNLPDPADRARVLAEMCRVLKPDGHLLLADIENHAEYAARLTELGCVGVRREVSRFWDVIRAVISFGSFRPSVIVARQRSLLISSSKTPE